jgi:hypothetical protein
MVAELLDAWSEWRPRKGEIAERTMLGYRSLIEHKIIPAAAPNRSNSMTTLVDAYASMAAGHLPNRWSRGAAGAGCWHGCSLGLSVQASEGWADLPATTRPPQRVQPEAAQSV